MKKIEIAKENMEHINAGMKDLQSNLASVHESAVKLIEICKAFKEQSNE